jgi:hypothetical protein
MDCGEAEAGRSRVNSRWDGGAKSAISQRPATRPLGGRDRTAAEGENGLLWFVQTVFAMIVS